MGSTADDDAVVVLAVELELAEVLAELESAVVDEDVVAELDDDTTLMVDVGRAHDEDDVELVRGFSGGGGGGAPEPHTQLAVIIPAERLSKN